MRISLLVKLFVAFLLVIATCLVPSYLFMKRWQSQIVEEETRDLNGRAEWVSRWLATIPQEHYDVEVRKMAEALGVRISIFSLERQLVVDSSQGPISDALPNAEELMGTLKSANGYGQSIRPFGGYENYLYIARLFVSPSHQTGIVRLSKPFTVSALRNLETVERFIAAGAASLVFLLLILFFLSTVRGLKQLKQHIHFLSGGDLTHSLSLHRSDEVGQLGQALIALQTQMQKQALTHSMSDASYEELVRVLPIPLAILQPTFGIKHMNPAFRQAMLIDASIEHARLHRLRLLPEFIAACEQAKVARVPQHITLKAPWLSRRIPLSICPLPTKQGEVEWALIVQDPQILVPLHLKEVRRILTYCRTLLEKIVQSDPADYQVYPERLVARFTELRIYSDLASVMQTEEVGSSIVPIDLQLLLNYVITDVQPLLTQTNTLLEWTKPAEAVQVADSEKRVEYVLRALLARAIGPATVQQAGTAEPVQLLLLTELDERFVHLYLAGIKREVLIEDVDRVLAPLGGGINPLNEDTSSVESPTALPELMMKDETLWIRLRRA